MIGSASNLNNPNAIIKYRDPYTCLDFRLQVQRVVDRTPKLSIQLSSFDIPAIIEAVAKRGGSRLLGNRIKQVQLSLPYYDPNIIKHAIHLLQNKIQEYFHQILVQTSVVSEPFIQQHLLPISSGLLYYEMNSHQRSFMQENFIHMDQYFCIKTLAYFGANLTRLDRAYHAKYYKTRRWLYINDYIHKLSADELKIISIPTEIKICIVGISVANIVLGRKLSRLGLIVKIMDFSASEIAKWVESNIPDIIKQGVFVSNEAEAKRIDALLQEHVGLSVNRLFHNQKTVIDQNTKNQNYRSQEQSSQLDKYEEIFISFLEEIFRQYPNNSDKLMWDELNIKVATFNNNPDPRQRSRYRIYQKVQASILKAYYDRLIHLNKLKNSKTATVADVHKFVTSSYSSNMQSKTNKIRMAMNYSTYNIRYQKLKQSKFDTLFEAQDNFFSIERKSVIDKLEKDQNKWKISLRGIKGTQYRVEQFDYLIYGVYRSVKQSELISQPLNSLFAFSSIHCFYKFKEKVSFRSADYRNQGMNSNNYAFHCSQFGIIHFYLMGNSDQVLACLNYNNTSIEHYKEIQLILNTTILRKPTKIQLPCHPTNQYSSLCTYYCTEEEQQAQTLSMSREQHNLYFNPPLSKPLYHGNILANSFYINNCIAGRIWDRVTQHLTTQLNLDELNLMEEEKNEKVQQKMVEDKVVEMQVEQEERKDRDWFGLESKLVAQWKCMLTKIVAQIQKYHNDEEGHLPLVPNIQITWPIPLQTPTPPTLLLNIGIPYHQDNKLHLLYYTSTRVSVSLVDRDKTAIFYQTCILYNQQVMYCIVEMGQQLNSYGIRLVLFHNKLDILMDAVDAYVNTISTPSIIPNNDYATKSHSCYICPNILVEHIRQSTQLQHKYTQILNNRIQQLQQKQYKGLPSTINTTNADHINDHACDIIKYYCRMYGIKQYTLADLLVGEINLEYICWEIDAGYQGNTQDNQDLTAICLQLLKQLIHQQKYHKYSIKLNAGACSRRFISATNIDGKYYQEYTFYTFNHTNKYQSRQSWIKQIITNLLMNNIPCQQIIRQLYILIEQELQPIIQIINLRQSSITQQITLYNYILMTRLATVNPCIEDKQQKYSSIKELICTTQLTNDEQSQLQHMIKQDDVAMFGREFILAYSE